MNMIYDTYFQMGYPSTLNEFLGRKCEILIFTYYEEP